MRLTDNDLTAIQSYVDSVKRRSAAIGLELKLSPDPAAFAAFLSSQEKTHGVPATHDPSLSDVRPGNFFWLQVWDGSRVICCHAQRVIATDSLIEEIRTYTVFGNLIPSLDFQVLNLYEEVKSLEISGRVGIGGGLWISPDWRGKGLTELYSRIARVLALRQFKLDYYAAFFLNTRNRRNFGTQGAAITRAVPLLNGYYPPHNREVDIQMMYMSGEEILKQARADVLESGARYSDKRTPAALLSHALAAEGAS